MMKTKPSTPAELRQKRSFKWQGWVTHYECEGCGALWLDEASAWRCEQIDRWPKGVPLPTKFGESVTCATEELVKEVAHEIEKLSDRIPPKKRDNEYWEFLARKALEVVDRKVLSSLKIK